MHLRMYQKFLEPFFGLIVQEYNSDFVKTGELIAKGDGKKLGIKNFIPRFASDSYCESFGDQWRRFPNLQHDSKHGRDISHRRIVDNTKWDLAELRGKEFLEVGCGPGRFTEIFAGAEADVVAFDLSSAIDINLENCGQRANLLLLQADISSLIFLKERFDYVLCYGVLQHTPIPREAFNTLLCFLKPGGNISVDIYRKRLLPTCFSTPKYLWRPVVKRMSRKTLWKILEWYIPKYIDFDTSIKKIPKFGCVIGGLIPIPCWNYLNNGYSKEERIQHAIMDTFDALSPMYDKPQTKREVLKWFQTRSNLENIDVFYGSNGIIANARFKTI